MKRSLLVLALSFAALSGGLAQAATVKLGSIPASVDSSPKLLSLTDAGIRNAFPSAAGRPDAVFMTEDRKVSVAFEWRSGKLAPNEVEKLLAQFPAVIKAQVPNIKTLKSSLIDLGGQSWAQFVFTTPGQGDDLRRELVMTSLGGRVFVMTIAGNVKDYSRNEATIRALANSVHLNVN